MRIQVSIPPYDGEYEFDIEGSPQTTLEWRWTKKISGYLPLTAPEGLKAGDPDLFVAWAVIAMVRAGKIQEDEVMDVADVLARWPFDGTGIRLRGDDEDEGDVSSPLDSGEPSPSGSDSSEPSELNPGNVSHLPTGSPPSDTGSQSDQATSA